MCVNSIHTCNCLQVKTLSMSESVHVAIALQLFEMSSITTHNQTILIVCAKYIFQEVFLAKISEILPICNNEKNSIPKFHVNGIGLISGICLNIYKFCKRESSTCKFGSYPPTSSMRYLAHKKASHQYQH